MKSRNSTLLPIIIIGISEKPWADNFPNLWIFEADNFSSYLPIIYNIRKAKIAGSYHKFLGLTDIVWHYVELERPQNQGNLVQLSGQWLKMDG
jgi:hypothetical protein